jgi:beta-galactosidase
MYSLPFQAMPELKENQIPAKEGRPALYAGIFNVNSMGDIFLDMQAWGKGIVFVNGYNLGRYWNVGPQQTLYLPGAFLKKGKNEIAVFEQINEKIKPVIPTSDKPVLKDLRIKE